MNGLPTEFEKRFRAVAEKTGYPFEAFLFVFGGIWFSNESSDQVFLVDPEQLCWRLRDYAIIKFGQSAGEQLEIWNIRSTLDFGQVVFGLVREGVVTQATSDTLECFRDVFDFKKEFRPALRGSQWSLSALLLP